MAIDREGTLRKVETEERSEGSLAKVVVRSLGC
jgi:hypothetical protein